MDRMRLLSARLQTFQEQQEVAGKRVRWRYTAIPDDLLAIAGFYYSPRQDATTGAIQRDSVGCIYCGRVTGDLQSHRSKRKRKLETVYNILTAHNEGTGCENTTLILKYREKKVIKWSAVRTFNDPLGEGFLSYSRLTFGSGRHNSNTEVFSQAGLIEYNISLTNFQNMSTPSQPNNGTCFCPYSQCLIYIDPEIDALKNHFQQCKDNQCYFFDCYKKQKPELYKILLDDIPGEVNKRDVAEDDKFDEISLENESSLEEIHEDNQDPSYNSTSHYSISEDNSDPHSENTIPNSKTQKKKQLNSESDPDLKPDTQEPPKKVRKLKKLSPVHIKELNNSFNATVDSDSHEEKVPFINFEDHYNRKRDKSRKNILLDDSIDDVGFSVQGSVFDIPQPSIPLELQSPIRLDSVRKSIGDTPQSSPLKIRPQSSTPAPSKEQSNIVQKATPENISHEFPRSSGSNNQLRTPVLGKENGQDLRNNEYNSPIYSADESSELDTPQSSVIPSPITSIVSENNSMGSNNDTLGIVNNTTAKNNIDKTDTINKSNDESNNKDRYEKHSASPEDRDRNHLNATVSEEKKAQHKLRLRQL
ncbi:hypothetical protein RNJ44_01563 [Nakaseomyces bracarensis]|uniref:Uncharacterized protein n=1 Tax=Nakaseomyces bracarensis TaxID=273131 RepID=A0ABR4NQ05_9SACH